MPQIDFDSLAADPSPPKPGELFDDLLAGEDIPASAYLFNASKVNIRAFIQGLAELPKGVAVAADLLGETFPFLDPKAVDKDVSDYVTYKWGQAVSDFAARHLPSDPRIQGPWKRFFFEELPQAFGSMGAFVVGGSAAKAVGGSAVAATLAMGSAGESASHYDAAIAAGASEDDAKAAAYWGALIGTSEAAPVGRIFQRFNKASGGLLDQGLRRMLKEGFVGSGEEMIQELFQTSMGNLVVQRIYDSEQKLVDDLAQSGGAAGIVGFTANLIAVMAGARLRGRSRPPSGPRVATDLQTSDGARSFVASNPTLLAIEKPSRAAIIDAVRKDHPDIDLLSAAQKAAITDQVRQEIENARTVRADQGELPEEGLQPEGSEETRGEDLQQEAQTRAAAGGAPLPSRSSAQILELDELDQAAETQTPQDDVQRVLDYWNAGLDETFERARFQAVQHEEQVTALAQAPRATAPAARNLDEAMQLYIDLREAQNQDAGTPTQQFEKWRDQLTDEQIELYHASQSLTEPQRALAEQIARENRQLGQRAQDSGIIDDFHEYYTARIWQKPDTPDARPIMARFTLQTPRAKARTMESMLEGWARGFELRVKGAVTAQRVAHEQIGQVIHDRALVDMGFKAGVLRTKLNKPDDWRQIEHPGFYKWEYSTTIPAFDKKADPQAGYWVRPPDRENLGKITDIQGDQALVHFKNRETGAEADVMFPVEDLRGRIVRPRGVNYYVNEDGDVLEKREVYAPPELAKYLNNALGKTALTGPVWDNLTKFNALMKQVLLTTSLFHHQAFGRSYLLGGRVPLRTVGTEVARGLYGIGKYLGKDFNPAKVAARAINPWGLAHGAIRNLKGFQAGKMAIEQYTPEYRELVRAGLTIGRQQEFDELVTKEKTWLGSMLDRMGAVGKAKDWLLSVRDAETSFLFNVMGPHLKTHTALIEYQHLLRKHEQQIRDGTLTREQLAGYVANLMNDDFGGLHLRRLGRSPTHQHIFRLLALAPDWTESNVRTMVKAIHSGNAIKADLYRQMWARVAIKGVGLTILGNFVLAAMDDDDFVERYHRAWQEGHLRWLDIDVTPIYRALGGSSEKRKYFSLVGHFRDPIKFVFDFGASVKHKGSVLTRTILEAGSGTDWAQRRFTTLSELLGFDEKGVYRTSRAGHHEAGEPKGGRLRGKLVTFGKSPGHVTWDTLPSYLAAQVRNVAPIQVQQAMGFLAGEIDAFDAITKSLGMMTATTFPGNAEASLAKAVENKDRRHGAAAFDRLVRERAEFTGEKPAVVRRNLIGLHAHRLTERRPRKRLERQLWEQDRINAYTRLYVMGVEPSEIRTSYAAYVTQRFKKGDTRRNYMRRFNAAWTSLSRKED